MNEQQIPSIVFLVSIGTLILLLGTSHLFWGSRVMMGVLIGGGVAIANLYLLGKTLGVILRPNHQNRGSKKLVGAFLLKFLVLIGVFALALQSDRVHILGLFLGCSVVVIAIIVLTPVIGVMGLKEDRGSAHGN